MSMQALSVVLSLTLLCGGVLGACKKPSLEGKKRDAPLPVSEKRPTAPVHRPSSSLSTQRAPRPRPRVAPLSEAEQRFARLYGLQVSVKRGKSWVYFRSLAVQTRTELMTFMTRITAQHRRCIGQRFRTGCRVSWGQCEGLRGKYELYISQEGLITEFRTLLFSGCAVFQIEKDKRVPTIHEDWVKKKWRVRRMHQRSRAVYQCERKALKAQTGFSSLRGQWLRISVGTVLLC